MADAVVVLLVADDETVVDHAKRRLAASDESLEVEVASSIEVVLDTIDLVKPDCIVTEFRLPDGDGVDLIETLTDRGYNLPVILYSEVESEVVVERAADIELDGYIQRDGPGTFELVSNQVHQAVEAYQARRNLELSERRHRELTNWISDGLFVVDTDWQYTFVNRSGADTVEREPEEMLGQTVWSVFPEIVGTPFEALLRTTMEDREPGQLEAPYGPHGRWYEVRTFPTQEGISILFSDITDRVQRVETLSSLHAVAGELFQAAETDSACRLAVDALDEVLGYPLCGVWLVDDTGDALEPTRTIGRDRLDVDPPSFHRDASLAWEVYESGQSRVFDDISTETALHNPDTLIRSEMIVPIKDHGVIVVSSLEPAAFDADDLQVVELTAYHLESSLERIEHERRIERERNRFEAAFNTVPEPAVHVVFDGEEPRIKRVNEAFVETFGIDAETAPGRRLDSIIVPSQESHAASEINRAVKAGDRYETELIRKTPDGERPFLFTAKAMPSTEEATAEAIATYVDLSNQFERELELQRQNARLEHFADVLSHDIPNHLTSAAGYLELAQETGDPAHFEQVATAHDRIESLLGDMQQLIKTGSPIEVIEPIELKSLAWTAWGACFSDDEMATLEVADDMHIMADRSRLTQMLDNLFWNAMEHAGRSPVVRIGPLENGFYIEDDGPGIPEEERDLVFNPGYTTSSRGTGFGLAIVREVSWSHGWEVTLTEGTDGGARFEFTGVEVVH